MVEINKFYRLILNHKYIIIIGILTLFAFILRFHHLDYNSLWGDEIATVLFLSGGIADVWNIMFIDGRPTPPLYYALEALVLDIVGVNEFSVRLLSALFGSLSIPLMYLLGKKILCEKVGLISATLLTVSIFHIYYSQEGRCYALLLFLFILVTLSYIKVLENNKIQHWILFSALSALVVWTHFIGVIGIGTLLLHYVVTLIQTKQYHKLKGMGISIMCLGLFVSPLVIVLGLVGSSVASNASIYGLGIFFLPQTFLKMFCLYFNKYTMTGLAMVAVLLLLWLFGMYATYKSNNKVFTLVGCMCVIPLLFGEIVNIIGFDVWYNHFIYVLPFYLLGISSTSIISNKSLKIITTFLLIVSIILYACIGLPTYYGSYTKDDWRSVGNYLYDKTEDGDFVFGMNEYYYDPLLDNTTLLSLSLDTINRISNNNENHSSMYIVFSFDLSENNITNKATSGSLYLDKLITKIDTAGYGNEELIKWITKNTKEIALFNSKSPYHEIHIHKVTP